MCVEASACNSRVIYCSVSHSRIKDGHEYEEREGREGDGGDGVVQIGIEKNN